MDEEIEKIKAELHHTQNTLREVIEHLSLFVDAQNILNDSVIKCLEKLGVPVSANNPVPPSNH